MKKIIVPVDFSDYSEYALETAAILARKSNAEILALHMLEISDAIINKTDSQQQAKAVFFLQLAEKRFVEFLDKDYLKDVKVTPIVKHFKVFSELNDVAKETNADLIVMGSHGSSGIKEIFIGSNTEKVVRHSEIPVLVVKHKPKKQAFDNVIFASDFSIESITAYIKASRMFSALGANFHLLYINLPTNNFKNSGEMEERVSTFLQKANGNLDKLKDVSFICDYSVEQGVLNFSKKIGADLIAIPTHGRKGISHFFEGSITESIANHAVRPVMTFKI